MLINITDDPNVLTKTKSSTNSIRSRFHGYNGAIATIKAHDLWNDVEVAQDIDSFCTSCKMTIISSRCKRI